MSVHHRPGDSVIQVGTSAHLSAYGHVSGITGILYYDRVPDAVWSVSDSTIARVTPIPLPPGDSITTASALVLGLRPGSVRVAATARRMSGSVAVLVVAAP